MIELALTSTSAHRLRFALSPLDETLGALQTVHGLRGHPARVTWMRTVASPPDRLPIAQLVAVLRDGDYVCDFLSPPPEGPDTTAATQLTRVRRTPPAQVAEELRMLRVRPSGLPEEPHRARDLLADQLEIAWNELTAPHWTRLRNTLNADIDYRSTRLAAGGFALAVADLHPGVHLAEGPQVDTLVIRSRTRLRINLDRRGLLLVPSVFTWPKIGVITVAPWQPAVLYPARGIAQLRSEDPISDDALVGVVGRTKTALLHMLDGPTSTSALASSLDLAISTVSEHLTALHAAGLLTASRRGRSVLYARSELGEALLRR